jgi:hypothetical protein
MDMGDEVANMQLTIAARGGQLWRAWVHSETGLHVQQRKGQGWRDVPIPNAKARDPLLRIAGDGSVFLSWWEIVEGASAIIVARWTGDGWQRLGAALSGMPGPFTNAGDADLAPDAPGGPVVAWQERENNDPVALYVAQWDGNTWKSLPPPTNTRSDLYSLEPALAVDPNQNIWLAWNGGNEHRSFVRISRWTGTGWEDVGGTARGSLRHSAEVRAPRLDVQPDGHATVLWGEWTNKRADVYVADWDGKRWKPGPPPLRMTSNSTSSDAVIARGQDGALYLARSEPDSSDIDSVYVQRRTSSGWEWVVRGAQFDTGPSDTDEVRMAVDDDLYVAWPEPIQDRGVPAHVVRFSHCPPGRKAVEFSKSPPRASFWPKTVRAAVDNQLKRLSEREKADLRARTRSELIRFHHGWGTGIRNEYGLWRGNAALLKDCGNVHPDDCSMKIIEGVWERLVAPSSTDAATPAP